MDQGHGQWRESSAKLVAQIYTRLPVILPEEQHRSMANGRDRERDPHYLSGSTDESMADLARAVGPDVSQRTGNPH